jgi:hypothetical protein
MTADERFDRLDQRLDALAQSVAGAVEAIHDVRQNAAAAEQRTVEAMRDMQTEILRGIEAFARGNFARMHILDTRTRASEEQIAATNDRITALEERVLNLETRRPPQ